MTRNGSENMREKKRPTSRIRDVQKRYAKKQLVSACKYIATTMLSMILFFTGIGASDIYKFVLGLFLSVMMFILVQIYAHPFIKMSPLLNSLGGMGTLIEIIIISSLMPFLVVYLLAKQVTILCKALRNKQLDVAIVKKTLQ